MTIYLNDKQKNIIFNLQNPPGHNQKNINFYKVLWEEQGYLKIEIGYWITYIWCRPKYNRDFITIKKDLLFNEVTTWQKK